VGPKAGLNECEKFRPHRDSIPVPFSPYQIAIPSELSRPVLAFNFRLVLASCFILCHKLLWEAIFFKKKLQMVQISIMKHFQLPLYHILKLR